MARESIELEAYSHSVPIPSACRVGPLVMTSAIPGRSPQTGELGGDLDEQVGFAFEGLAQIFKQAGGSVADIARVTVLMTSREDRDVLNRHWERWFPDPASRPARHVQEMALPPSILIQIEAVGFIERADSHG